MDGSDFRQGELDAAESRPERLDLPLDHPGRSDEEYLARRAAIAAVASAYVPGQPIPTVAYAPEEHALWALVARELRVKHEKYACAEYLAATDRLALPTRSGPATRAGHRPVAMADRLPARAGARPRADAHVLRRARRAPVPVDAVHAPPLGAVLHTRARHRARARRPRQHAREPDVRRALPGRRPGVAARDHARRARVLQPGVLVHARVRRPVGRRRAAHVRRRPAVVVR